MNCQSVYIREDRRRIMREHDGDPSHELLTTSYRCERVAGHGGDHEGARQSGGHDLWLNTYALWSEEDRAPAR